MSIVPDFCFSFFVDLRRTFTSMDSFFLNVALNVDTSTSTYIFGI